MPTYKNLYNTSLGSWNMSSVFITGGTGFIGQALINSLIKENDIRRIYLLVRDKEKSLELLSRFIDEAQSHQKEIVLFRGDISKEDFGLDIKEIGRLGDVEEVYHLASIISLSNKPEDRGSIIDLNLGGTKNLLKLITKFTKLKNLYYFSTAYACGVTDEKIQESWLIKPNKFRNHYEESKWLSEELIRNSLENTKIFPIILRPSIVCASSSDDFGKVLNQTFYYFSRILKKASENQSDNEIIRLTGSSKSTSNIIPISDLISLIIAIRSSGAKKGFYNLVNPENLSTESFIEGIEESLDNKVKFSFEKDLSGKELSESEKFIYDRTRAYVEYNKIENIEWSCKNTSDLRGKINIGKIDDDWIKKHIINFLAFLENER